MEQSKGNTDELSVLTGKKVCSINEVFRNPKNKELKEEYLAIREKNGGTKHQQSTRKRIADISAAIPGSKGVIRVIAKQVGLKTGYTCKLINENDELKKKCIAERNKAAQEKNLEKQKHLREISGKYKKYEIDESLFLKHQLEFANLRPDEVKHPALVGGFGCGKTMAIPLRWLLLIDFRTAQNKACEMMILEPTNEMVRDILLPCFDEFFERLEIKTEYLARYQNYSIFIDGKKHTAKLRSADKPRSLTGRNLTDFIIDEFDKIPYYKQKILWRELISRIRRAEFGTGAVVTTPEGFKMTYELWGNS